MKDLFTISIEDVQPLALKRIGRQLTTDELSRVKKGLKFGLEAWEDVVLTAIDELIKDQT